MDILSDKPDKNMRTLRATNLSYAEIDTKSVKSYHYCFVIRTEFKLK